MGPIARDTLIDALQIRYDYYSARALLEQALGRAGLPDQQAYSGAELRRLRDAIAAVGDRVDAVLAYFDQFAPADGATASGGNRAGERRGGSRAPRPGDGASVSPARTYAARDPADPPTADSVVSTSVGSTSIGSTSVGSTHDPAALSGGAPVERDEASPTSAEGDAPIAPASAAVEGELAGRTRIVVRGAHVPAGAVLHACGASDALGAWRPEEAAAMQASGPDEWAVTLPVDHAADFDFKLLWRLEDGEIQWEAGDNRQASALRDAGGDIVADWRGA